MTLSNKSLHLTIRILLLLTVMVVGIPSAVHSANSDNTTKSNIDIIRAWFNDYDQIRRQAQLSPQQRQQADQILGKGLAIFMPGEEKIAAQNILSNLTNRYQIAYQQMGALRKVLATEQLHHGYYQYFSDAQNLFSDYLKLQNDLMAVDGSTGQPIARGLVERKQNLSILDQNNKALDAQLRQQYGIAPYQY